MCSKSYLCNAIRGNDLILEDIFANGQREQLGKTMAIKLQLTCRDAWNRFSRIRKVRFQKVLNSLISRAKCATMFDQKMLLLLI